MIFRKNVVDISKKYEYNIYVFSIYIKGGVFMKDIIRAIDNLPFIVKLILALPGLAVVWAIYRLLRSLDKNNVVGIVLAVILIVAGPTFFWIVDIITLLLKGNVWWID